MLTTLRRWSRVLGRLFRSLARRVFKDVWMLWIGLLVVLLLLTFASACVDTWDGRFRFGGALLQWAGLITVILRLRAITKDFQIALFGRPLFRLDVHRALHRHSAKDVPSDGAPLSEQVAGLKKTVTELISRAQELNHRLDKEVLRRDLEAHAREAELREAIAGDIHFEWLGVVWLLVGVALASLPCEVAGLFGLSCHDASPLFRFY